MAKKHKKYRGLGNVMTELNRSVSIKDVYVGAALAFLGNLAVNALDAAVSKPNESVFGMLPAGTAPIIKPLVAGAAAGGILYMISRKKNPGRAVGHLAGAVASGIGLAAKAGAQTILSNESVQKALPDSVKPYLRLDGVPVFLNGVPVRVNGPGMRPYNIGPLSPVRMLNGVPVRVAGPGATRYLKMAQVDTSVP